MFFRRFRHLPLLAAVLLTLTFALAAPATAAPQASEPHASSTADTRADGDRAHGARSQGRAIRGWRWRDRWRDRQTDRRGSDRRGGDLGTKKPQTQQPQAEKPDAEQPKQPAQPTTEPKKPRGGGSWRERFRDRFRGRGHGHNRSGRNGSGNGGSGNNGGSPGSEPPGDNTSSTPPPSTSTPPATPAPETPSPAPGAPGEQPPGGGGDEGSNDTGSGDSQQPAPSGGGVLPAFAVANAAGLAATGPATGVGGGDDSSGKRKSRNAATLISETNVVTQLVEYVPDWVRWALGALAGFLLLTAAVLWRERRGRRRAEQAAMVDPLTGVSNRLAFERLLTQEWHRAKRFGHTFSVLLIDLDGFKQINDQRGHSTGDRVLRVVALQMQQRVRETDTLARIGGDEFAVICPETASDGASILKASLEEEVSGPSDVNVGLSIGIAEHVDGDRRPLDIVDRADAAMYEHKREHTAA